MKEQFVFVVYKDKKKEWRWQLKHHNKNVMADSGEGYKRKGACVRAIVNIAKAISQAKVLFLPS